MKTLAAAGTVIAAERLSELGTDPVKGFSPEEAANGARYEKKYGVELVRSQHPGDDFVIKGTGITVDAMGAIPSQHFKIDSFRNSLVKHLRKSSDRISIDGTGLTTSQQEAIKSEIEKLSEEERARVDTVGFE